MSNSNQPIKAQWVKDLEVDAQLGKELCAILMNHCGERGDNEGAVETLQRIIRERDFPQSETAQSPQWIALAERQPDEMQTCLVFPKEGEVGVDTWGYFEQGITHWMPMPKEPK